MFVIIADACARYRAAAVGEFGLTAQIGQKHKIVGAFGSYKFLKQRTIKGVSNLHQTSFFRG